MKLITGTALSNLCDYSFGDHLGGLDPEHLPGGFMKEANRGNQEFLDKCKEFEGKVMTLFIDNIRLYPRDLVVSSETDAQWVTQLMSRNDLLGLCASLQNNKFIIFTSHEDTPIDSQIRMSDNVLAIYATNAIYNNKKIHPFPYGLQRQIERGDVPDKRIEIMLEEMDKKVEPTKLLYVNCGLGSERNAQERAYLPEFSKYNWATTRFDKDSRHFPYDKYRDFLDEFRDHKYIICPQGHGIDCHRNWEALYLRRVPVMKKHPYFTRLMRGFPVLFVDDWAEVTKELLESSPLYNEAQRMDLSTLDLDQIYARIKGKYERGSTPKPA